MIFRELKTAYLMVAIIAGGSFSIETANSAETTQELAAEISDVDRLFWKAYNHCDTQEMAKFVTDDVEFYHDKDGLIVGKEALVDVITSNLCSETGFRLRREGEEAEQAVFPVHNYGAIMTGKHSFYVNVINQKERLDSTAAFTHVWKKKAGQWKMSRIMSYAHAAAGADGNTAVVAIASDVLQKHVGHYQAAQTGAIAVEQYQSGLRISAGESHFDVLPESETLFFHKDSPLSFEFVRDNAGMTKALYIRENGNIVEEATRVVAR